MISVTKNKPQGNTIAEILNGKTINRKATVRRLKYWGHVMRRPARHILRKALDYQIKGKLKVGRPCFTWKTTLNRDLERSTAEEWMDTIDNKELHSTKCESVYDETDSEAD